MNNYCMIQNSKTFAFSAENPTGVRAVSYTHLDVYKRQVLCLAEMPDHTVQRMGFFLRGFQKLNLSGTHHAVIPLSLIHI